MRLCKPRSNLRQFLCISPALSFSLASGHRRFMAILRESAKCAYLWDGAATCVSFMHVGWHTNPQSSAASATAPPSLLCLSSCMLCVRIRVPIAPHGSHICIYVRDGSIVMRGRWQCKCDPGPEPHATTLCECIELCSCRRTATWRMRNICNIYNNSTWPHRTTPLSKEGGLPISHPNLIALKVQLTKLLKYEKCLRIAKSETKWKWK